ncbi:hypothetical protein OAN61_00760 [bacterium]|nr:hypothetical protein [bacterium]
MYHMVCAGRDAGAGGVAGRTSAVGGAWPRRPLRSLSDGGGHSTCRCKRDGLVRAHGGRCTVANPQNLWLAGPPRRWLPHLRPIAPRAPPPTPSLRRCPLYICLYLARGHL